MIYKSHYPISPLNNGIPHAVLISAIFLILLKLSKYPRPYFSNYIQLFIFIPKNIYYNTKSEN